MGAQVLSGPGVLDNLQLDACNITMTQRGSGNSQVPTANLQNVSGGVTGGGALSNAATLTNAITFAPSQSRVNRVQATAACTSCVLSMNGLFDGQDMNILNAGATAITFSTPVFTLAANPAAGCAASFLWDAGTTQWCKKA